MSNSFVLFVSFCRAFSICVIRVIRGSTSVLICLAILGFFPGCKKKSDTDQLKGSTKSSTLPAEETILRVHWLGKQRISSETNSGYFTGIWNTPESLKLQGHILDQFALAPIHLLQDPTQLSQITNHELQ